MGYIAFEGLSDFEWVEEDDEGKGYREWQIPASFIREHARLSLADEELLDEPWGEVTSERQAGEELT